jgi:hypothetical protein
MSDEQLCVAVSPPIEVILMQINVRMSQSLECSVMSSKGEGPQAIGGWVSEYLSFLASA